MQIVLGTTGARSGAPRAATLYAWEDGDALVCRHLEELSVRTQAEDSMSAGVDRTLRMPPHLLEVQGFVVVERRHQCGNDASDRNALHRSLSVLELV